MKINILMSTYNGDKYLREQIDSILEQSYQEFILFIRDDGSSDKTVEIIKEYYYRFPNRVVYVKDDLGNIGVAASFERLMNITKGEFYFFADQDDVWRYDKVEKMMRNTNNWDNSIPQVCFSDLEYFYDQSEKSFSFMKRCNLSEMKIKKGLYRGTIPGCSMVFNNACKQKSLILNSESKQLHDYNIFMTANLFGKVSLLNEVLIRHRIHKSNVIGVGKKEMRINSIKNFLKFIFNSNDYRARKLSSYFEYVNKILQYIDLDLRFKKELYTADEVLELPIIKRKIWYLNHFNPFQDNFIEGVINMYLI